MIKAPFVPKVVDLEKLKKEESVNFRDFTETIIP